MFHRHASKIAKGTRNMSEGKKRMAESHRDSRRTGRKVKMTINRNRFENILQITWQIGISRFYCNLLFVDLYFCTKFWKIACQHRARTQYAAKPLSSFSFWTHFEAAMSSASKYGMPHDIMVRWFAELYVINILQCDWGHKINRLPSWYCCFCFQFTLAH